MSSAKAVVASWLAGASSQEQRITSHRACQEFQISLQQASDILHHVAVAMMQKQDGNGDGDHGVKITLCQRLPKDGGGGGTVFRLKEVTSLEDFDSNTATIFALASTQTTEALSTALERDLIKRRDQTNTDGSAMAFAASIRPSPQIQHCMKDAPNKQRPANPTTISSLSANSRISNQTFKNKVSKQTTTTAQAFFSKHAEKPNGKRKGKDGSPTNATSTTTSSTIKPTKGTKPMARANTMDAFMKSSQSSKKSTLLGASSSSSSSSSVSKMKRAHSTPSSPSKLAERKPPTSSQASTNIDKQDSSKRITTTSSNAKIGNADDFIGDVEDEDEEEEEKLLAKQKQKRQQQAAHRKMVRNASQASQSKKTNADEDDNSEQNDDDNNSKGKDKRDDDGDGDDDDDDACEYDDPSSETVYGAMDAFATKKKPDQVDRSKSQNSSQASSATKGRARRKRLVEKTYMENGYLHTKMETVWEEIPEDELRSEDNKRRTKKPIASSSSSSSSKKSKSKSTSGKSKPTGMKQGTLMGFFKPKK